MESTVKKGKEQRLLDVSLVLLVTYNVIFLCDVALDGLDAGRPAAAFMAFVNGRRGWVTLFESIAALSLFADLVVRFDAYPFRQRQLRIVGIALVMAGLVFKAFTFYLDSAYLE